MICFVNSLLLSIYNKNNEVIYSHDIGHTENFAPILQDESCNKIKRSFDCKPECSKLL